MADTVTDVATLVRRIEAGDRYKFVYFWGHRPRSDGVLGPTCLSQWYASPFETDGVGYATAEHFMMAEKARLFGDAATRERILRASSPGEAKKLGRQVRRFDEDRWLQERFDIVVAGNVAKFCQSPALRDYLVGTGDRVLVEASPVDAIWGTGLAADDPGAGSPASWRGLNLLGFALMQVRASLVQ